MGELGSILHWVLTLVMLFFGYLVLFRHQQRRTLYSAYFMFLFVIFYGPTLFYSLGFTAYHTMISNDAMRSYMYVAIVIYVINIFYYRIKISKKNYLLHSFFRQIKEREEKATPLLKIYFYTVFAFVMGYIILFFNRFPVIQLFTTGELGLRPDTHEVLPLYITISGLFITIIPSGFLFLFHRNKNWWQKIGLLLLTIFILIIGGNKGIISFFLIYFFYYSSPKINYTRLLILVSFLGFVYAYTKGITTFDAKTFSFLLESPFKRVFATQGVGLIGRMQMMQLDLFDLSSSLGIKNQVYEKMYRRTGGSVPTMFLGDLLVKYGYIFMLLSYMVYITIIINIMKTIDRFFTDRYGMYITWNLFLVIELFGLSDLSMANMIRVFFIVFNLIMINLLVRVKLPSKLVVNE